MEMTKKDRERVRIITDPIAFNKELNLSSFAVAKIQKVTKYAKEKIIINNLMVLFLIIIKKK